MDRRMKEAASHWTRCQPLAVEGDPCPWWKNMMRLDLEALAMTFSVVVGTLKAYSGNLSQEKTTADDNER